MKIFESNKGLVLQVHGDGNISSEGSLDTVEKRDKRLPVMCMNVGKVIGMTEPCCIGSFHRTVQTRKDDHRHIRQSDVHGGTTEVSAICSNIFFENL
jgi:hypothetical protein